MKLVVIELVEGEMVSLVHQGVAVYNRLDIGHGSSGQQLEASLTELHRKVDLIMAGVKTVNELLDALNSATNEVAADLEGQRAEIANLRAQIAAGTPVSQEQLDGIAARLGDQVARLQTLAADPANPVPGADNPPVPANA